MELVLTAISATNIQFNIPSYAQTALDVLERNGFTAYLVGGWVRDALMGSDAHDVDISTSARWEQVSKCFQSAGYAVYETGTQHGTVSVNIDGNIIEITTYRTESGYKDSRHPDRVEFVDNIELDLKRRDFTINAMAYNPSVGLIDLFGGREDIASHTLRCVGDPYIRFDEDALRILRAVRFASRLEFDVAPSTQQALNDCAYKLRDIAYERIGSELSSIVASGKLSYALRHFGSVMNICVPQFQDMVDFDQMSQYHAYDCMEHTIRVVESVETITGSYPCNELRWAAYWHDIAKPSCMYVDSLGQGHFPDHPEVSTKIAFKAMRKMALPTHFITNICALIREHDEPIEPTDISMIRMLQRLSASGVSCEQLSSMGYAAIYLRQADALAKAIEYRSYVKELDACKVCLQEVLDKKVPLAVSDLHIAGGDVLELTGIDPGPQVGKILSTCLEEVIKGHVGFSRESQINWLSHHASREGGF